MRALPRKSPASFSVASSPTLPLPLPTTDAFRHSQGMNSGLHLRTRTDGRRDRQGQRYHHNTNREEE